ncbi:MAG: hypothetical protein ACLPVW_11000 [Terriglobales bacterium]
MPFHQPASHWIAKAALVLALTSTLVTCGDPAYQPPPIMLAFSPGFEPPAVLNTGAYAGIAVTVTNDTKNGGVNFSCTPDQNLRDCGSFTPSSAASTVPTCYLAPASVPTGGSVTITGTSATDPTKFISAQITIQNGVASPCP